MRSPLIETLEPRQHLSVATKTTITESAKSAVLGQPFTITAKENYTSARGTVELLDNNKDTGITGTLNHKGYIIFSIGPGDALYTGDYKFSARYLSNGNYVGSKSHQIAFDVASPTLTTESDGLQIATVTPGTGAPAATNDLLVMQYTGFYTTGSVFDDSAAHSPGTFSFNLNATDPEQVIAGFDQGATGMTVGETRVVVIPSALGYNDGQTRVFVIHLVADDGDVPAT